VVPARLHRRGGNRLQRLRRRCEPEPELGPERTGGDRIRGRQQPARRRIGCQLPGHGDRLREEADRLYGEFSQIKAVDRYTVEFDLCAPDVAFLSKIAFATNGIQDSDWLAKHAPDKSYVKTTNGTGPYMFKEWVSGDHITLVANPNYWGKDKPIAQTLIFKWADTAEKRLQDLQAGPTTADGIDNVATDDFATVKADPNLQLINRDAFTILYLGFNVDKAPWNNESVRQAIAMGIDRKRINDTFNPPGSSVADYFTPCNVAGGCEGDPWYSYDKAKAIQMLKDANFDFTKTYDLYFRPKVRGYFPNPPGVATDIQAQFKDLGITLKVHTEDNATYLGNSSKGQYSLFLLGWGGDYPDMTDFVDYHFGIGAKAPSARSSTTSPPC